MDRHMFGKVTRGPPGAGEREGKGGGRGGGGCEVFQVKKGGGAVCRTLTGRGESVMEWDFPGIGSFAKIRGCFVLRALPDPCIAPGFRASVNIKFKDISTEASRSRSSAYHCPLKLPPHLPILLLLSHPLDLLFPFLDWPVENGFAVSLCVGAGKGKRRRI